MEQICIGRSEFYYSNLCLSSQFGGETVNFSETLKRLMEQKGISKYRLAKDLGVSQSSVANWINGSIPHEFMLDKIAAYFGCSAIALKEKSAKDRAATGG